MHANVRQYRVRPDQIAELTRRVDAHLAERLAREPGFVTYELMVTEDGQLCSMTVFEDLRGAQRSQEIAAEFVRTQMYGIEIERLSAVTGEVLVSRPPRGGASGSSA